MDWHLSEQKMKSTPKSFFYLFVLVALIGLISCKSENLLTASKYYVKFELDGKEIFLNVDASGIIETEGDNYRSLFGGAVGLQNRLLTFGATFRNPDPLINQWYDDNFYVVYGDGTDGSNDLNSYYARIKFTTIDKSDIKGIFEAELFGNEDGPDKIMVKLTGGEFYLERITDEE